MFPNFIDYLDDDSSAFTESGKTLRFKNQNIEVINDIPRFTPNHSYSTGNFSKLREKHATLQLDSKNGTHDRERTVLERTQWPREFFKGKTILECGCGAGPDTEILRSFGARVLSVDIAGVDIARNNIGNDENVSFVQASIMDLPFKKKSFDIVWCHRVIQHTPDPKATLNHILQFVKDDGAVFVHSYARTYAQMLRWKYLLWPITKRMDPEKLYNAIKFYAPLANKFTNFMLKFPAGKYFNFFFVPFCNYRNFYPSKGFNPPLDEQLLEHGIHDTFDALSPEYDEPLSATYMREMAQKHLSRPVDVAEHHTITLMRTQV